MKGRMLYRALKALRLFVISADIVLITALIDMQMVPVVAVLLAAVGTRWAVDPLIPEPAYDWPRWVYWIGLVTCAWLQRHRTRTFR